MMKKLFYSFGSAISIIVLLIACKGTVKNGGEDATKNNNAPNQQEELFEISFSKEGEGEIVATIDEKEQTSPLKVKKGVSVKFKAKAQTGWKVKKWDGVDTESPNKEEATLEVKQNKEVKVFFSKKGEAEDPADNEDDENKATIEFFEEDVKCSTGGILGVGTTEVKTGSKVAFDTTLDFTAKISGTTTIEAWLVSGEIQENQKDKNFRYKVRKDDVKDGKIIVTLQKTKGHAIIVKFGGNITCKKTAFPLSKQINSESQVELGDTLTLSGTPQQDKQVDKWYLNGVEKETALTYTYKVKKEDLTSLQDDNYVLEFSFSERELKKLKVHFDPSLVSCNKPGAIPLTQGEPILNDSEVTEGDKIIFSARKKKHQDVKEWLIKDVAKQQGKDTFNYTVAVEDADASNVINVSWTVSWQIKVEFDKKQVICKTKNLLGLLENEVKSGQFHSEGTSLYLYPKLKEGEIFKGWLLNDKPYTTIGGLFLDNIIYKVDNAQAIEKSGDRYIKISIKVEKKDLIFLRFDDSKLSCEALEKPLYNNNFVYDKVKVSFTSKLGEGKGVAKWMVNGVDKGNVAAVATLKKFEWVVYADQAKEEGGKKYLDITIEEKDLAKVTINFDSNSIECKNEEENDVASGEKLYEATLLSFTAKNLDDRSIDHWKVGKKKVSKKDETIHYTVDSKDATEQAGEYSLSVSYVAKEKLVVKFDPATIICEVSDGAWFVPKYTTVQNGESLEEGSFLRFTPAKPDKEHFVQWLVNGLAASGNKTFNKFTYTLDASKGVLNSEGKKEVVVSIQTK